MALARSGTGLQADVRAVLSQVHPIFMLPPVAASIFGGVLTGTLAAVPASLHAAAIFFAVYTAHVKDGFVDFYVRDEDDHHPVTPGGCRTLLSAAFLGFSFAIAGLWLVAGLGAVLVTLPTWIIGYAHAPQLDTNPIGASLGYPTGIALAILGGAYVQTGAVSSRVLAFALVFLIVLAGIKVIDDTQDYAYDRSIAKRTVAVVIGPGPARRLGFGCILAGLALTVGFVIARVFPVTTVAGVLIFGAVAALARRADPTVATMLLVRGAYLFLAAILVAIQFFPGRAGG